MKRHSTHYLLFWIHLIIGLFVLLHRPTILFIIVYAIIILYLLAVITMNITSRWRSLFDIILYGSVFLTYFLPDYREYIVITSRSWLIGIFSILLLLLLLLLYVLPITRFYKTSVEGKKVPKQEIIINEALKAALHLIQLPLFLLIFYQSDEKKQLFSFVFTVMILIVVVVYVTWIDKTIQKSKRRLWMEKLNKARYEENKYVKDKYKDPLD